MGQARGTHHTDEGWNACAWRCIPTSRGTFAGTTLKFEVTRGLRSLVVANVSAIGCIGKIIVATRGEAGPGEVLVQIRGGSEAFIAWSQDPLPKGTTVLVIDERGNRALDVSAWTDPLGPDQVSP
jgi:hypothetical protein